MIAMEGINQLREFVNVCGNRYHSRFSSAYVAFLPTMELMMMNVIWKNFKTLLMGINRLDRVFSGYLVDLSKLANVEFDAVIRYLDPDQNKRWDDGRY